MKLTAVISACGLLFGLGVAGSGTVRAQDVDAPATTSSTSSSTTTTTTTEPVAPLAPSSSSKLRAPGAPVTTNVEVTTPPTATPPAATSSDNVVVIPTPAPLAAPPPVENRTVERYYVEKQVPRRIGAAVTLGGGVMDFTGSNARDVTNTGGYWNARVISGTRNFLGVEAAYVGSARDVSALGLSNDAMLVSNGVEGALRLNVPIIRGPSIVEPFAFAGMGWSRYNIARSNVNTSSLASSDDIMEIPYGAGISMGYGGFLADARFTYRSTYFNDLMRTPSGNFGRLDNWSLGGQIGVEF